MRDARIERIHAPQNFFGTDCVLIKIVDMAEESRMLAAKVAEQSMKIGEFALEIQLLATRASSAETALAVEKACNEALSLSVAELTEHNSELARQHMYMVERCKSDQGPDYDGEEDYPFAHLNRVTGRFEAAS